MAAIYINKQQKINNYNNNNKKHIIIKYRKFL